MMNQVRQRLKYLAGDWLAGNVAFLLFDIYRFHALYSSNNLRGYLGEGKMLAEQTLVPLVMLAVYWLSGFYNRPFGKSRLEELITTFFSSMLNAGGIYFILLINDPQPRRVYTYQIILVLFLLLFISCYAVRYAITETATKRFRARNWNFKSIIVGASPAARAKARALESSKSRTSRKIVAFLEIPGENAYGPGMPDMGAKSEVAFPISEAPRLCKTLKADEIIVIPSEFDDRRVLEILHHLFPIGLPVKIIPDTLSYITPSIRLKDIYGEPMVDLTSPPLSESAKNIKRVFDFISSLLMLVLLSPMYCLLGVMVKASSRGPVFYSQERIGRRQRPFRIFKFRTMVEDAEEGTPLLSSESDPRITRLGRFMRKYRLDELPQFWNVLKGEMSVVGPRPEREHFIRQIIREAPYYSLVYQVRPGITSWGMVKYGYASNVAQMVERTRYDLIYITNMSLFVDLKILIYTIKTVLTGKGL